ncbi:hypothetical protein ADICYQ_2711 [Cyclobacterium qasimii M12-11B]|uniref:Uncharacterized protein n=1 Tax=Cyclobacterium qasimii M12-11B TaxID=641524 RepID=S7VE22_9BACT|nr:hypothetical protein ADICYQ_2711 [Cyclobacterium qasimii M12-11B]
MTPQKPKTAPISKLITEINQYSFGSSIFNIELKFKLIFEARYA